MLAALPLWLASAWAWVVENPVTSATLAFLLLSNLITKLTPYPKAGGLVSFLRVLLDLVSVLPHKDSLGALGPVNLPFVRSRPPEGTAPVTLADTISGPPKPNGRALLDLLAPLGIALGILGLCALAVLGVVGGAHYAQAQSPGIPAFRTSHLTLAAATATKCPTTPMLGRTSLAIGNLDSATIYVGGDSTVTASTGFPIPAGGVLAVDMNYQPSPLNGQTWCYSTAGTAADAARILETR